MIYGVVETATMNIDQPCIHEAFLGFKPKLVNFIKGQSGACSEDLHTHRTHAMGVRGQTIRSLPTLTRTEEKSSNVVRLGTQADFA